MRFSRTKNVYSAKQWDKARTTTQFSSENSNKLIRNKNTNHQHHLKNEKKSDRQQELAARKSKRVGRKRKSGRVEWSGTRDREKIRKLLEYYDTLDWLAWKSFVHNVGMTGKRLEFVDNLIELKVKLLFSG